MFDARSIADFDAELDRALAGERERQETYLELIASENYVSPRVLAAQGSLLTNKYADGYPGERHYAGCELADVAEGLAIERAQQLFGAGYANVQPYSGSQANLAAYLALLSPGDTLLGMRPAHGGHRTHGAADNQSGALYNVVPYDVAAATGELDYDAIAALAREHRPKLVVAGFSAYSRIVDWARFRAIADDVGACCWPTSRMSPGSSLTGLYPSPVALADVTTTTTHKTLRGPRGGMILAPRRSELTRAHRRGSVSRHARRPIDARHRGQSGRVQGSARAVVHRVSTPSARERTAHGGGLDRARLQDHDGRHRQSHAARRPARCVDRRCVGRACAARGPHRRESRLAAGRHGQRADSRRRRLTSWHAGCHDARPRRARRFAR